MYLPFLRGKQFEIRTLIELAPLLRDSSRLVPVLEPVRVSDGDVKNLSKITQLGVPLVVIENPAKGDLVGRHEWTQSLVERLSSPGVRPGFLISSTTSSREVDSFLKRNKKRRVAFIHMGMVREVEKLRALQEKTENVEFNVFLGGKSGGSYREAFSIGKRVILEDGFERQAKNEDYPVVDFFSDRFMTFKDDGFDGFGDFLIVGNQYTKSGGGALAVAIHLTNREGDAIVVRHFVSDRTTLRNVDTAGKFFEALQKARTFIKSRQNWKTTEACQEFLVMTDFKGLGHVKKVSMKHHIELMDAVLASNS